MARRMPQAALTTLSHHIDIDLLREAHRRTRKDGATGVDEVTAQEYASKLDESGVASGAVQIGNLLGTASATSPPPERRWDEDPAHRHPDV